MKIAKQLQSEIDAAKVETRKHELRRAIHAASQETARLKLQAQLHAAKEENRRLTKANLDRVAHTANVSFATGLVQQSRWPAAASPVLVATLDHLDAVPESPSGVVTFGEGKGPKPLAEALRKQLLNLQIRPGFGS